MEYRSVLLAHPKSAAQSPIKKLKSFPKASSIVIVGEDKNIAHLLARNLTSSGFNAAVITDWVKGQTRVSSASLIIVPLNLNVSLLRLRDIHREIREHTESPIMIVADDFKECDEDTIFSLAGCDVLVDLFFSKDVVAHIRNVVRGSGTTSIPDGVFQHQNLRLEHQKHKVTMNDHVISLTPSEYKLLYILMASPGRVFLRDELLDVLYERDGMVIDRVIDVHIGKIRKKIEIDPTRPQQILTVRGVGYKFTDIVSQD